MNICLVLTSVRTRTYPDHFLEEALQTMELLFPSTSTKPKHNKRTRRYGKEYEADLEALVVHDKVELSTSNYPVFGSRMAAIQSKYNDSRPRSLSQYWFDRRNRSEWAALWIAVLAFFIASVLGIISSVTSIVQVVVSER